MSYVPSSSLRKLSKIASLKETSKMKGSLVENSLVWRDKRRKANFPFAADTKNERKIIFPCICFSYDCFLLFPIFYRAAKRKKKNKQEQKLIERGKVKNWRKNARKVEWKASANFLRCFAFTMIIVLMDVKPDGRHQWWLEILIKIHPINSINRDHCKL